MKYLKPTAYLTFKRVFGEHPDLIISLLNAMLPLAADKQIVDILSTGKLKEGIEIGKVRGRAEGRVD